MPDPRPARYRRRRVRGWRKPAGSVCVGRETRWGNPFTAAWAIEQGIATGLDAAREPCVYLFAAWLNGTVRAPILDDAARRRRVLEELPQLAGKPLVCWCPPPAPGQPDHCHAQVLIDRANPTTRQPAPEEEINRA